MPTLTQAEQVQLLGRVRGLKCDKCGEEKYRNYCRECDEFFFECLCNGDDQHIGHRTY